ncbi:MAG: hypothetical protein OEM02_09760 [Desulfobulbaceae bacterium]|nr:hypothetical protein [Desulfobulbaceae bacterium]
MNSDQFIIELNQHYNLINELEDEYFDSTKMFNCLSESLVDKRTLNLIEIQELFKAVNFTETGLGSARLFHSLHNPHASLELIHAKQEALKELESNDRLYNCISEYLGNFAANEKSFWNFFNFHYQPISPYGSLKKAMESIDSLLSPLDDMVTPKSDYLVSLLSIIKNFRTTTTSGLIKGPAFRTFQGIQTRKEKGFFTPSLRLRRGRLSGGTIVPGLPSIGFTIAGLTGMINPTLAESMVLLTGGGLLIGFLYGILLKPLFDNETAILSIRQRFLDSDSFISTMEAVACLDELMSFYRYNKNNSQPTIIPEITDKERHFFIAKELCNPVILSKNKKFVPYNLSLDHTGITFVTGPNSGGKTTFCKTIAQNQILAQIGAPIAAKSAKINLADRISYQAPAFDSLNDDEGRFGTELRATKNIFLSTTPKSLIFLDEIAEGTTSHERMELSLSILDGFLKKFNNTVLVTHNYELADTFRQQGMGQYFQVEFKDNNPSHRMVEGISRTSHAMRIAKKIGFAPEDIDQHLRDEGYI